LESGKRRAARNRTVTLTLNEKARYWAHLATIHSSVSSADILDKTLYQDLFDALPLLPRQFVDLLIIDPPYNLNKIFNSTKFTRIKDSDYLTWVDRWFSQLIPTLKPAASVYICADWRSSTFIFEVAQRYLKVRNRITWEREKGRGSERNWKNTCEDIWFCTVSDAYTFNVDSVKLKRRVIAPYTHDNGDPKDWEKTPTGNFRLTHPSNLWTDITIPFWSMPENTDHPTQKPEKLIAKLVLASSRPGDIVLDPFLGSGTTSVVAKKLGRHYLGIEIDPMYCCLAEKRLELAESDSGIQGYAEGVFWERNSTPQTRVVNSKGQRNNHQLPFVLTSQQAPS
jgi:site-specific DNA-methyltransferase (adenine-specific)